jgi:hypothetical protein
MLMLPGLLATTHGPLASLVCSSTVAVMERGVLRSVHLDGVTAPRPSVKASVLLGDLETTTICSSRRSEDFENVILFFCQANGLGELVDKGETLRVQAHCAAATLLVSQQM